MLDRLELLINDKVELIKNKKILIIGLGGVGGYTVESLVRSGVDNITIVDNDIIDISNLNRQVISNINNIGKYKTDEWEIRIKSINPNCNVKKITEYITMDNIDLLFNDNYDYIIDACDSINVKKEIIRKCTSRNIKFISSMGTGNKFDPSKLEITDLRKTSYDPLARILRKMVKDEHIKGRIPVVCSSEVPKRVIGKVGSTSFVPSVAGLLITSFIIRDIVGE